jgi:hypothetical protein
MKVSLTLKLDKNNQWPIWANYLTVCKYGALTFHENKPYTVDEYWDSNGRTYTPQSINMTSNYFIVLSEVNNWKDCCYVLIDKKLAIDKK